jgi:hypothetical protein
MSTEHRSRQERVAEQTAIRRALLKNGYSCFPCAGKTGQPHGWPSIVATEALVDEWADQFRWVSTAVHVGPGGLIGLDVDIDDAEVMTAFVESIPADLWEKLSRCPVRYGGGVKEMWLARLKVGESGRYRDTTGSWGPAGADSGHKLEVWTQAPKLLVLYGARSVEGGEVTSEYSWLDGRGPCEVSVGELPEVGLGDIERLIAVAVEAMRGAGWDRLDIEPPGEAGEKVADLHDGMRFVTAGFGEIGLGELRELCAVVDSVRMRGWDSDETNKRTDRCLARLNDKDGRLQITDFHTGVVHREAENYGLRQVVAGLGERLNRAAGGGEGESEGGAGMSRLEALAASVPAERRLFGGAGDGTGAGAEADADGADAFEAALQSLVDGWAWVTIGGGFAAPLGGTADQMLTLGGLKNTMAPWLRVEMRKRTVVEINPADVWLKHPQRKMVAGHKLIPWTADPVAEDEYGQAWVNTYQPPRHLGTISEDGAGAGGAVADWSHFLEHLVPDARERAWFEMWLAAKVQKPWIPNCGVVMVAETHGTGRGTLFDMLMAVMGDRHVKPITSTELMGGAGQGQYTDWLADSLLVVCDELLAGNDAGGAMEWKRREVYERLKSFVDPRARRVRIVRKGLPGYDTEVYASFLLATNNPNALPLAEQDRRFAVIRNTSHMLADTEVHEAVTRWRQDDQRFSDMFGAAVWRRLAGLPVEWAELRDAPGWMEGRQDMLAANESALDEVLAGVLADVPGNYVLGDHLRERIRLTLQASGMEGEIKNWWVRAQDTLSRRNGTGWRRMARRQDAQPRTAGRKFVSVFYRVDGPGEAGWTGMTLEQRAESWRRGADLSDKLSRLDAKVRERGLKIVE